MRSITSQLNEKINSNQQTPANNADPKMSILVSRARTTIMDSEYWLAETIRHKDGLGDISLAARRMVPYGSPDRIFEIHVDESTVKTTIRNYPDLLKDGWKPQFELGEGSSVAIAFDGGWELYRNKWRIVTEEKPYLFWVDSNNILWSQLWDDVESRVQLGTSVVKVKAIRGWKSVHFVDKDQGIVVVYIKTDGKVYYRNWCQQSDLSFIWESEKAVTEFEGVAETVNLFITNDYRLGLSISDDLGSVRILITKRNWSGMGLVPENISSSIANLEVNLIPVTYKDISFVDHLISSITDFSIGILWAGATAPVSAVNDIGVWVLTINEDVGVGDGIESEFSLLRNPEQDLVVYLDGVETTEYTISDNIIQFTSAPGVDVVITADYSWLNFGGKIRVIMDHGITDAEGSHGSFIVKDANGASYYPTRVEVGDIYEVSPSTFEGTNVVILIVDINAATNPIEVRYTSNDILHGEIGQSVASFTGLSFTAQNLKPIIIDPPEVEAIWNE